jgi:hypothetical protein
MVLLLRGYQFVFALLSGAAAVKASVLPAEYIRRNYGLNSFYSRASFSVEILTTGKNGISNQFYNKDKKYGK